jgi:ribosome-associated protein
MATLTVVTARPDTRRRRSAQGVPGRVRQLLERVEGCLAADKAEDVVVIDLGGKTSIADFMVVASGRSHRQVRAMSEHLTVLLKRHGMAVKAEGAELHDWVLLDAGDIIVHLFRPDIRAFYNLEKMWSAHLPEPERAAI